MGKALEFRGLALGEGEFELEKGLVFVGRVVVKRDFGGFDHDEDFEKELDLADLVEKDLEFDRFIEADLDFFLLEVEDELAVTVDVVHKFADLKRLLESLQDLRVSDVKDHFSVQIHNFEHRRLHKLFELVESHIVNLSLEVRLELSKLKVSILKT